MIIHVRFSILGRALPFQVPPQRHPDGVLVNMTPSPRRRVASQTSCIVGSPKLSTKLEEVLARHRDGGRFFSLVPLPSGSNNTIYFLSKESDCLPARDCLEEHNEQQETVKIPTVATHTSTVPSSISSIGSEGTSCGLSKHPSQENNRIG